MRSTPVSDQAHRASSRGREFQMVAIPLFIAAVMSIVLSTRPLLFPRLLAADVSFLAQGHVCATFCRVWTMGLRGSQRRILTLDLLIVSILSCLSLVSVAPVQALVTLYLQWQMFHYTRQSFGIERIVRRRLGLPPEASASVLLFCSAYAPFLWSLGNTRGHFLGMPVFEVPERLSLTLSVVVALIGLGALCRLCIQGRSGSWVSMFLVSHIVVFSAYVVLPSLDQAWLVSNTWHNAQYLLVVREAVQRTAGSGEWSFGRVLGIGGGTVFLTVCIGGGALAYTLVGEVTRAALVGGAVSVVAVYMGINFHHYIIDGLIWKRRSTMLEAL